jgi:3-methylcrotonyl-CoA carboxylase alpha subunit
MTDRIVSIGGDSIELSFERDGTTFRAGDSSLELVGIRGTEAELRVGGRTHFVPFLVQGATVSFVFDGEIYTAEVVDKGSRAKAKHRDHSMSAPMPGVVLKILTAAGAVVRKGTPLVILEAMKMEHQIVAPYDGIVRAVNCTEGEMVQPGVDLITLEAADAAPKSPETSP